MITRQRQAGEELQPVYDLLDTFPRFQSYWQGNAGESHESQLDTWARSYLAPWPGLRDLVIADYAAAGQDWRVVAKERVIPAYPQRLKSMRAARRELLATHSRTLESYAEALPLSERILLVIYVGIGSGAGWATRLWGRPVMLLGLESIVECGWDDSGTLENLITHELAHLAHAERRRRAGLSIGTGPWWQLYVEGLAQRWEVRLTGRWHQTGGDQQQGWLAWCQANLGALARRFTQTVGAGTSARNFFGAWYDIKGMRWTGNFLGHEAIRWLQAEYSLHELALLEDPAWHLRRAVTALCGD